MGVDAKQVGSIQRAQPNQRVCLHQRSAFNVEHLLILSAPHHTLSALKTCEKTLLPSLFLPNYTQYLLSLSIPVTGNFVVIFGKFHSHLLRLHRLLLRHPLTGPSPSPPPLPLPPPLPTVALSPPLNPNPTSLARLSSSTTATLALSSPPPNPNPTSLARLSFSTTATPSSFSSPPPNPNPTSLARLSSSTTATLALSSPPPNPNPTSLARLSSSITANPSPSFTATEP